MKFNQDENLKIARALPKNGGTITFKEIKEMVQEAEQLELPDDAWFSTEKRDVGGFLYVQLQKKITVNNLLEAVSERG